MSCLDAMVFYKFILRFRLAQFYVSPQTAVFRLEAVLRYVLIYPTSCVQLAQYY